MEEILIHWNLTHPNVVTVHGCMYALIEEDTGGNFTIRTPNQAEMPVPAIVVEYCNGSLADWMTKCKEWSPSTNTEQVGALKHPYSEEAALHLMLQVAKGMNFLHDQDIIHQDLKPQNVLISYPANDTGRVYACAKVADFGYAAPLESHGENTTMKAGCKGGTPYFRAPESFRQGLCNRGSDVYAFGIMLHTMFVTLDEIYTYSWLDTDRDNFQNELLRKIVDERLRPHCPTPQDPGWYSKFQLDPLPACVWQVSWTVRESLYELMQVRCNIVHFCYGIFFSGLCVLYVASLQCC